MTKVASDILNIRLNREVLFEREIMPNVVRNIIFLLNPDLPWDKSLNCGRLYLNRFCIDEEAAFELSGVYSWDERSSSILRLYLTPNYKGNEFQSFQSLKFFERS